MSRDKFEEFARLRALDLARESSSMAYKAEATREAAFAWLAGRESMRDEAAKELEDFYGIEARTGFECADAIRKIEL